MASYLRPRRGKASTAISNNIILKRGEVFFETPSDGVGKGIGKIKIGDGSTAYGSLPYFVNTEDDKIAFTDSSSAESNPYSSNNGHLSNIVPGSNLKTIFTNLKQLLVNYNSQLTGLNNERTDLNNKLFVENLYIPARGPLGAFKCNTIIYPSGKLVCTPTDASASVAYGTFTNCNLIKNKTYYFQCFEWDNIAYINVCKHGSTSPLFTINSSFKHITYESAEDVSLDILIYISNKSSNASCKLTVTLDKYPEEYIQPSSSSSLSYNTSIALKQTFSNNLITDMNDMVTLGMYFVNNTSGTILNAPSASNAFNVMVFKPTYDNSYVSQIAIGYGTSVMYLRSYNPNTATWSSWFNVTDQSPLKSAYVGSGNTWKVPGTFSFNYGAAIIGGFLQGVGGFLSIVQINANAIGSVNAIVGNVTTSNTYLTIGFDTNTKQLTLSPKGSTGNSSSLYAIKFG